MIKISAIELANKWIEFFKSKGHFHLESQSLIPYNDHSLLFVNSGISAIKHFFSGQVSFHSKRIVNCQKVVRTGDIDSIGNSHRHLTYFEMLGNFSLGDYFKIEAINWAYEFLIDFLEINPNNLYFTVYKDDEIAFNEWKKLIKDEKRIIKGDKETNFWDMGVGPCGPCTEIYFDRGSKYDPENIGLDLLIKNIDNERYLEIWNIVFSEFLNDNNKIIPLNSKNIDTGAGLERLLTVLEGVENNFENSLIFPIIQTIQKYSNYEYIKNNFLKKDYESEKINRHFRIISDHLRTVVLLLSENIEFGNKSHEYVLRRLFRKALLSAQYLDLKENFLEEIINTILKTLSPFYPELINKSNLIKEKIIEEKNFFLKSLDIANKKLDILLKKYPKNMPEKEIFLLFTRDGLPKEIIFSSLKKYGISFSEEQYEKLIEEHKLISKNLSFTKAFVQDNKHFLNLNLNSSFNYEKSEISNAKIIALFNEKLEAVSKISGKGFLILNETIIFPECAGQESDSGWINGFPIFSSFRLKKGETLHYFEEGEFFLDQIVKVSHDINKRLGIARNHTAEHLLYGVMKKYINSDISRVSGDKKHNKFFIEIDTNKDLKIDEYILLVEILNSLISKNISIKTEIISLDTAKNKGISLKFCDIYEEQKENLRYVEIGDISQELCIGTHLKNTSEIESFLISSVIKKQKNIYKFECITGNENTNLHLKEIEKIHLENIQSKKNKFINEIKKIEKNFNLKILKDILKRLENIKLNFLPYNLENYWKNINIFNSLISELDIFFKEEEVLIRKNLFTLLKDRIFSKNQEKVRILEIENFDPSWLNIFFNDHKNNMQNFTLILFNNWTFKKYFYLLSNIQDLSEIFNFLNSKFSCKGGGSKKYIQGIIENPELLNKEFFDKLKEFSLEKINT